jgi:ABC-type Fe3+/spermidine/putrescine transport system ATPase subunit
VLGHPTKRRLLVLDEPFKFLSEQYRPAIRELIEQLAQELQFQFIVVTHIKELEMGDVVVL